MRGSAPGGSSQAAAARRCGTIGASWRSRGVAPGALATVGAAEAPILEWRRAVLKRVALHTVSGAEHPVAWAPWIALGGSPGRPGARPDQKWRMRPLSLHLPGGARSMLGWRLSFGRTAHLSEPAAVVGAREPGETGQPRLGDRFGLRRLVEIDTLKGTERVAKSGRLGRRSTVRTPAHELHRRPNLPQNRHGS